MDLKQYITIVPDFPKPGILFKDITTLMDNGEAYKYATDQIVEYAREKQIDIVVGPEARGLSSDARLPMHSVLVLHRYAKKENCRVKSFVLNTD